MLDWGQDSARRLALELLEVEGIRTVYGLLFLENLANALFHALGQAGVEAALGRRHGLSRLLQKSRARVRWQDKIHRELKSPYGDRAVFAALQKHQAALEALIPLCDQAWICGSFCKATFSAHSDLDVAVLCRNPSRRLLLLAHRGVFLLPADPRLERVELLLCGPILPLPLTKTLEETYWAVLRQRGFGLSPRPRVVALPSARRVREVPLWLEDFFKRSHPQLLPRSGWHAVRKVAYQALGSLLSLGPWLERPCRAIVPAGPRERSAPADAVADSFAQMARDPDTPRPYAEWAGHLSRQPLPWLKVNEGQSPARLFFAVVRYLGAAPGPADEFVAWCQTRRAAIVALMQERCLQINQVHRCGAMVAGLAWISRKFEVERLNLIEVGAAAGLLLNFAHYRLEFQEPTETLCLGPPDALVKVSTRCDRALPRADFQLGEAVGLDLCPRSAADADDCRWLECQNWKASQVPAALEVARLHPPRLVAGDFARTLPAILESRRGPLTVVFHSHTFNQLNATQQKTLESLCRAPSIVRLSLEWEDALYPLLRANWPGGEEILAACPRGELRWLAP